MKITVSHKLYKHQNGEDVDRHEKGQLNGDKPVKTPLFTYVKLSMKVSNSKGRKIENGNGYLVLTVLQELCNSTYRIQYCLCS